jgi:hypothetical protein
VIALRRRPGVMKSGITGLPGRAASAATPATPLADCVRLVTGLLDGMPGDRARSCLLAAAGGGTSRNTAARLRVIAGHLRGDPGALASGETIAPVDVLCLISELRRADRSDVAQPGAPTAGATGSCAPTGQKGSASAPPAPRRITCRSDAAGAGGKPGSAPATPAAARSAKSAGAPIPRRRPARPAALGRATAWCRREARLVRAAAIGGEKRGPASRKPEQLDAHPA